MHGFIASSSFVHQRHASAAAVIPGVAQQHSHKSERPPKQNTVLPAVIVDSSDLGLDEVIDEMAAEVRRRGG